MLPALLLVGLSSGAQGRSSQIERCVRPAAGELGRVYRVAAIGDSLTDPRSGGGLYLKLLKARCPASTFDAYGVGGQRTEHMRWRLGRDAFGDGLSPGAAARKPSYSHVLILGGINDLSAHPISGANTRRIERNLRWMYQSASSRGAEVIAVTIPPWTRSRHDRRRAATSALNKWMFAQQRDGRVDHLVDIRQTLSCGSDQHLCTGFRRFQSDSIHWGLRGHERVAAELFRQVFSDCR